MPGSPRFLLEWLEAPAGFEAIGNDVNDQGTIVGYVRSIQPWADEALPCCWLDGRRMVPLERGDDRHYGAADAINRRGTIVGSLNDRAVRWPGGSGLGNRPEELPTGGRTDANAINNREEIVGSWSARSSEYVLDRAFVWTPERMVWLEGYEGKVTLALDINDHGVVVGWSTDKRDRHRAVMWQDGQLTVLPTPRFTRGSGAYGVNGSGTIAGFVEDRSGKRHACLWHDGLIHELPGCSTCETQPTGINDMGWVTGILTLRSGETHPFLHTGDELIDLNESVRPAVGEFLGQGEAINNEGWIVGGAQRGNESGAFLLRPL